MFELTITPGELDLATLRRVSREPVHVSLDPAALAGIHASAAVVTKVIEQNRVVYGINTGFGLLANTRIPVEQLDELQRSIVLSHAAGIGEYMDDATVRLMMVLKLNSLARGFSGIRQVVLEALMRLINAEVYPVVPKKGSVGASGDLAPLAHMSCLLIGEGKARHAGELMDAATALKIAGLEPIALAPKEGLALLNGTQASTAFALEGLFHAEDLRRCHHHRRHERGGGPWQPPPVRCPHPCGARSAWPDRRGCLLPPPAGGWQRDRHVPSQLREGAGSYSLRCQPQVMGACLTQIRQAAEVLVCEANAVSDNPLVFAEDEDILSGGNFHAEPVAFAADNLALAIAEIGSLSERRMALLIDSRMSGLPAFLVNNGGVNSGFMIAQVTSAALASENKTLAHPASVDSLPTSANQEDHVSMATFAGRRLADMAENTRGILAVELLAAAQGLDFRAPLRSTELIELAKGRLREEVSFYDKDRYFAPDIEAVPPCWAVPATTT